MRHFRKHNLLWITAIATLISTGCSDSRKNKSFSTIASESAFDPKPDDTTTLEAQTKRFKGQTSFLNPGESVWDGIYLAAARSEDGQGSRDIQESDIFKIGPENSKLLYLLNNYRGLQVISYADGPESPKIAGRSAATGNWPDDMYFDEGHERLLVLENIYTSTDMDVYEYSTQQSRLLTYDVSDSTNPTLAESIKLEGRIRDSRIVGNVLYIATSVRPSYSARQGGDSGKGYVYSFTLTGSTVQQVDSLTLSAPVNYGENMNIVESKEGDTFKYYLIAVLADYSGWSWFGKKPIEVVDVSDPLGKIKPLMVVESKGNVSERSQTHIKNGSLIVSSNFANPSNLLRIAVESFALPTKDSQSITAFEANYRSVAIERAVKKLRSELSQQGLPADAIADRIKALKTELSSSGDLTLKGLFVESEEHSSLSKLMPDDVITFGSTQGLSARLQDVRYDGDLLYAFWVPANNIDPLDVIDISNPAELKHLSHLEFDGWIQRAIPISFQGKSYIVGLGWVIPQIDNDDMRRYPQAMLFEARAAGDGSFETKVISQKNLSGSSIWANFNSPDKFIELRMTSDSTGMLMYPFSSWSNGAYTSGGQLIGLDLSKINTDPANVFTAGSLLKGEESWLRRIFNNPEIDRINTFTDMSLGTYDVGQTVGVTDEFIEAANVLELARNITDYITFENNGKTFGIQVVSGDYRWSRSEDSETFLRLVPAGKADAELSETLASLKLSGTFVDAAIEGDHRLLVLTQAWKKNAEELWEQQSSLIEIDLSKVPTAFTEIARADLGSFQQSFASDERLKHFLKLKNGSTVVTLDDRASVVGPSNNGQIALARFSNDRCMSGDTKDMHFHEFNGGVWAHYTEEVADPEHANYFYTRHLISEMSQDGGTCSSPINIPGIPLLIESSGHVVTQDTRLIELQKYGNEQNTYYQAKTEKVLTSLRYLPAKSEASLVDLYDAERREISALEILSTGHIAFVESTQKPSYWFDTYENARSWPRPYPTGDQSNRLAVLATDDEFNFTKRSYALDLSGRTHATLVHTKIVGDKLFAVTKQGMSYSLWNIDENWNLQRLKFKLVDSDQELEKISVPGWSYSDKQIQLSDNASGMTIPNGYFGISQFVIVE